jgi:glycosyltransferase involved in cell wall biosynthesis
MTPHPHIAIVHEWLTAMRGGERCVEAFGQMFPDATIFTLLHTPGTVSPAIERHRIVTSFIQRLPDAHRRYRHYLPLFPAAVRRLDLREFDLVLSSHHCVAKGVRTAPGALHLCYCHTPMRYIWDQYAEYFAPGRAGLLTRAGMGLAVHPLRRWDVATAAGPFRFAANSANVRERIRRLYRRDAAVIHPPVDAAFFTPSARDDGYYLVVSAFVPYKRVDLAVAACTAAGERLVVVGDGPDAARLRALAGPGVTFAGRVEDDGLRHLYAGCRALLFPGEEDFGIVPLEAMASGKPVAAFGRGGALESVVAEGAGRTGVFFREQSVEALVAALRHLRDHPIDPGAARKRALEFDRTVFLERMGAWVASCREEWKATPK